MKKVIYPFLILIASLSSLRMTAQCNSTFAYTQQGSLTYKFTANQLEEQGFTYNYTWNFGGEYTYYTPTVTQYFYSQGDYDVCLTVSIQDSHGTTLCTDSTCSVVVALPVSQCFPDLYIEYGGSQGSTDVSFSSSITDYTNVSITWNFGDGSPLVSGVASPFHTYPDFGTYTVCLYATDTVSHCSDTVCTDMDISSCSVNSYISWEQITDGQDSITFYSYGNQSNVWNFGDGSAPVTSTGNITHTFPGPGEYDVCLTAGSGACQVSNCDSVTVDNCTQAVDFNYFYVNDSLLQVVFLLPFDLFNLNYQNPVFSFGDGVDSSADYFFFTHNYPALGSYKACFTANINGCGKIHHCDSVTLACNLAASFQGEQEGTNTIEYVLDTIQNYPGEIFQWSFGDGDTGNTPFPVHVYADSGSFNTCLTVTDTLNGCTASSACNFVTATFWSDTICGHAWIDENFDGIQDNGEPNFQSCEIQASVFNGASFQIYTDSNGNYSLVVPSNQGLNLYLYEGFNFVQTMPAWGFDYQTFFSADHQRQCGYDFGVAENMDIIQGVVYDDLNANGQYDYNDVTIPNQVIDVDGKPAGVSAGFDGYRLVVPLGSYTLSVDSSSYYTKLYPAVPAQIQPQLSYPGQASQGNDFAINVPTSYNDLGIDLIPSTPLVPGWYAFYQVLVTNYGPNMDTAGVSFELNTPAPLNIYQSGFGSVVLNSVSWTTNYLYPFNSYLTEPIYTVNDVTPINTDIYDTANIIGFQDANPANNSDTSHQITVSSFDPNNKLTSQSGIGPTGLIPKTQELKYVVHFQNTGTSAAINVVVRDVLDPNLDLNTFRFIGSSLYDPNIMFAGDTIYFRFSNANLSDSSVSPTYSTGWLAYSVKPKTTVRPATEILNNADVFFDYNTPVRTNTTLHTIEGNPLSVTELAEMDGQLKVSPNPFGLQIKVGLSSMPGDKYTYIVSDVLGREIMRGSIRNNQTILLNRGTMSPGTYLIGIYDGETIVKRAKIIAQ